MKPKIVAVSRYRYRASAAERRLYGGSTVTEFFVHRAEDARNPERWKIVKGYGPTPGERKTDAIRRSGLLEEPAARDRGKRYAVPYSGSISAKRPTKRKEKRWGLDVESEAHKRWRHARERARAIRILGWKPEDPAGPASERYAATTGELVRWAKEKLAERRVASRSRRRP